MKKIGSVFCLAVIFLFSCRSEGESRQPRAVQTQASVTETNPVEPVITEPSGQGSAIPDQSGTGQVTFQTPAFDPSSISKEEKDTARTEIQQLIQRLNGIIRAKNYNSWVSYLDGNYFAAISSAEYLDRTSKSAILVKQKIVLRSARDYFNHVVVPSRTNDRVDDIEYISPNRVKAYTFNNKGEKLRLYDLEKNGNEWKIIN